RIGFTAISGLVVAAITFIASGTWFLVKWDQVALWSVTVGTQIHGLWSVAFSDDVRFLLIGDAEIPKATFAKWVILHLAAPFAALVAVAITWASDRRYGREAQAPSVDETGPSTDSTGESGPLRSEFGST
ncbi:MAG TPA: hypothetical protein VL068_09505, partial [Microthrixaceae bacterium]|nr:hypothetical protein [Microthrixaceae bacterium]